MIEDNHPKPGAPELPTTVCGPLRLHSYTSARYLRTTRSSESWSTDSACLLLGKRRNQWYFEEPWCCPRITGIWEIGAGQNVSAHGAEQVFPCAAKICYSCIADFRTYFGLTVVDLYYFSSTVARKSISHGSKLRPRQERQSFTSYYCLSGQVKGYKPR